MREREREGGGSKGLLTMLKKFPYFSRRSRLGKKKDMKKFIYIYITGEVNRVDQRAQD